MLVGVVQKTSIEEVANLLSSMDKSLYDALEIRFDTIKDLDIKKFSELTITKPCIFTLRNKEQGGFFEGTEKERVSLYAQLLALKPRFADFEMTLGAKNVATLRSISPTTKVILSDHNFVETPMSFDNILLPMKEVAQDVIYKFACMAHSTIDALRMLVYCKQLDVPNIGISMGEYGETTRILAPVVNYGITYCPIEEASAPGQLSASSLKNIYNYTALNKKTAIYGLLGDPVERSIGHLFHNKRNVENKNNAVYVKWCLTKEELQQAMPLLKELDVQGLSVTMPLKETAMNYLSAVDDTAKKIGAVNTIKATSSGFEGTNTDGEGALACLQESLKDKKIVFLGAGGAAKAVMYAVSKSTKTICIYNRTTSKKIPIQAEVYSLEDIHTLQDYDIIINGLPFDAPFSFEKIPFILGTTAMDLSYGKKSAFLEYADKAGCKCVDGSGMFEAQASLQRTYWNL